MTGLVDLWRAVDPAARLLTPPERVGSVVVRSVVRTRAVPPHLPLIGERTLLVVDTRTVPADPIDALLAAIDEAGPAPAAVLLAGWSDRRVATAAAPMPLLASQAQAAPTVAAMSAYLEDEPGVLARLAADVRLAAAEVALADPTAAAPAGLVAARLRRGVAVVADREVVALHARPAGQALAARFVATVRARSLDSGSRVGGTRRTREGLWLHEATIRAGASVWLFDDLPFAAADLATAAALTMTLRALLRRPPVPALRRDAGDRQPPATGEPLADTLLAVARANGRVSAAARQLGVHRNTVLYRLGRARRELGVDPRSPEDALRLLRADEERRGG